MASIKETVDQANQLVAAAQNVSASGTMVFSHELSSKERHLAADLMRQKADLLRLKAATSIVIGMLVPHGSPKDLDQALRSAFQAAGISAPERDPVWQEARTLLGLQ